jgi:hypothetical protein
MLNPVVINKSLAASDTEYSVDLTGVRHFTMQCRTAADVRFAFETGKVAASTAPYSTMKSGSSFDSPAPFSGTKFSGSVYLANAAGSVVVELVLWY